MATAIIKFKAEDGTEFDTEEAALKHDQLVAAIETVMKPLGKRPKLEYEEYYQHDPAAVIDARVKVLELAGLYFDYPVFKHRPLSEVHPMSIAGRIFDDCGGPWYRFWNRFMCTDDQGREWQQPYCAKNTPANAIPVN